MTTSPSLPMLNFDLSAFKPKDRWAAWRCFQAGFYDVEPRVADPSKMCAQTRSFWAGESVFGEYRHDACTFSRDAKRNDYETSEMVTLMVQSRGKIQGIVGDQHVEMIPQCLTLFDVSRATSFLTDECVYFAVDLPYSAIGYDPSKHSEVIQIESASPVGRVLRANLETIITMSEKVSSQEGHTIGHGFGALVKGLLGKSLADEAVQFQVGLFRDAAIRRFVEANLRKRELNSQMIIEAFNVSRTELHKIFRPDGGLKNAIASKRLERARTELSRSRPGNGAIQHVASFWGFSDKAHFSRSFKKFHGVKPSDVIGTDLERISLHQEKLHDLSAQDELTPFADLLGRH